MNIAEILRDRADSQPDSAAIVDTHKGRDRITTFAGLERASGQGAALLWQTGLRPGDAVLVFQPMSMELYAALIAIFRLGLVPVFIDPSSGLEHIEQCCEIYPPRALIASTQAHLLRLASPALRRIPHKLVIGAPIPGAVSWARAARLAPVRDVYTSGADEPALITFTSGCTGQPKAAVRSHRFLLTQHRVLQRSLGHLAGAGDVSLTTLPVFVLADLASGATSLIPPGDVRHPARIAPAPVIAQMARHCPVRAAGSPAFWECLAEYCEASGIQLPYLEHIYLGGAPVFPHLLDALQRLAPGAEVVAVYGSTEAEPIAHTARHEVRSADLAAMRDGSGLLAGCPIPDIQLRVLPDRWGAAIGPYTAAELESLCLPPGTTGEIVVSGEHVLTGYLGGRGDHETKFRVDSTIWHRTGDAGYLDAEGRVWLLGRCSARIEDGRGALYPFSVECAASACPGVRRAAVVGHQGRRLLAVEHVEHASPADLNAVRRHVAWAQIDEMRVMAHIPVDRRHNAKIDYPTLYRTLERV